MLPKNRRLKGEIYLQFSQTGYKYCSQTSLNTSPRNYNSINNKKSTQWHNQRKRSVWRNWTNKWNSDGKCSRVGEIFEAANEVIVIYEWQDDKTCTSENEHKNNLDPFYRSIRNENQMTMMWGRSVREADTIIYRRCNTIDAINRVLWF